MTETHAVSTASAIAHPDRAQVFMGTSLTRQGRALLLDYDGTLAPFVLDRFRACPYPHVVPLLDKIVEECDTRVVIISGRSVQEVASLLKTRKRLEIWGCHGIERLLADGGYSRMRLSSESERYLECAAARLRACGLEDLVEEKPGCVAVHWRGLSTKRTEEVRAQAFRNFFPFAGTAGLMTCDFDGGLELRHKLCSKRTAVETILSEMPSGAVAYLGDDSTDEAAFRALNGRGLTVLVRPTYRFTAAQFWLRPPDELEIFLRNWINACRGML